MTAYLMIEGMLTGAAAMFPILNFCFTFIVLSTRVVMPQITHFQIWSWCFVSSISSSTCSFFIANKWWRNFTIWITFFLTFFIFRFFTFNQLNMHNNIIALLKILHHNQGCIITVLAETEMSLHHQYSVHWIWQLILDTCIFFPLSL